MKARKADAVAQPSAEGSVSLLTGSGQCDSANAQGGDGRSYSYQDTEQIKGDTRLHTLDLELKTCILSELTTVVENGCLEFNHRDL